MKKYFITGLVILLPLALTIIIVIFMVNLLTNPFIEAVQSILVHYGLIDRGFLFLNAQQVQYAVSQILILCSLFFATVFLGFIARWFLVHYLIKAWDYTLYRIPLIRTVYKTSQDVINTILKSDTKSFKQVVLVPFPSEESHSIGLITREYVPGLPCNKDHHYVAVFVPTTPNPTSGYLILYEKKDLTYVDMKVEEALKYIISCGVILNEPFKEISLEEAEKLNGSSMTHEEFNDEE
jgi:uncharacterized membrane protein